MNFDIIEKKRRLQNIPVARLCRLAKIDRSTYYKLLKNPDSATFSTVSKLAKAVDLSVTERAEIFN